MNRPRRRSRSSPPLPIRQRSTARCLRTCRVRPGTTVPRRPRPISIAPPSPAAARPAAGGCARSARTSPSNSNTFPPASRSSAMCGPSWRAWPASSSSRRLRRAGPSRAAWQDLLAHVMVSKYCDHTPLFRQSGIYARDGVHIDRSTMAGWVDQGDELLDPLVAALGRYALAGQKVHADDTPVKVLDPGRSDSTGRLWVYVRDDRPAASRMPQRSGSATRRTARASIRRRTRTPSAAPCRPTPTAAGASSTRAVASARRRAGRTPDGRSGICT